MRTPHTLLTIGVGAIALALAGAALGAAGKPSDVHTMTVQLPGGGVEQIEYTGDVAPKVTLAPGPMAFDPFGPASTAWAPGSAVQAMEQMNRRMDAMLQQARARAQAQVQAMTAAPFSQAALRNLPAGGSSFSFVSSSNGHGFCSRSVQITSTGDGSQPKVVTQTSGDCGPGAASGAAAAPSPAAPPQAAPADQAKRQGV